MRNLPQTVETFKTTVQDHSSDESPYNTVCPRDWPMNDKKPLHSYRGTRRSCSSGRPNSSENKGKLNQLCNYLAEHRTRLLLTFISLVFLSLFLVVIYRQFGWITFVSVLGIVAVPFLLIFIYAKRLEYKEHERNRKVGRSLLSSELKHHTAQSLISKPIFSTELEMENLSSSDQNKRASKTQETLPKRNRKSTIKR